MPKLIDLTGQRFGTLRVMRRWNPEDSAAAVITGKIPKLGDMRVFWVCCCDCKNICIRGSYSLTHSKNPSCGCIKVEKRRPGRSRLTECKVCGREVLPPRSVYCSDACAREWKQRQKRVDTPRKGPGGELYITRICQDCRKEYIGHIKSLRCQDCQAEADRRASAESKRRAAYGHTRKLGSTDYCQKCGQPYIVCSGLQRYCKDCAAIATRDNIRAHKRAYNKALYSDPDKREKKNSSARKDWQTERTCIICGKPFVPSSSNQKTCSDECRKANVRNHQRAADAKRNATRGKAKRAAEKLLPPEEQERRRQERNARARENYAKRKQKKSNEEEFHG